MKYLIKLEELMMGLLGIAIWYSAGLSLIALFPLLLLPDLGMIGYLHSPQLGSLTYNITHHKGVALVLGLLSVLFINETLLAAALIIWTHSSLDRMLGFGLKYSDAFKHTHLGNLP
jgi:hypothetical protein